MYTRLQREALQLQSGCSGSELMGHFPGDRQQPVGATGARGKHRACLVWPPSPREPCKAQCNGRHNLLLACAESRRTPSTSELEIEGPALEEPQLFGHHPWWV